MFPKLVKGKRKKKKIARLLLNWKSVVRTRLRGQKYAVSIIDIAE